MSVSMHFILLLVLLLLECSSFEVVALSRSKVRTLPGYQGLLPFQLETGYVNVDESKGVELFYYFVESERNPKEDPLMLWLTGGPGCSAFIGLVLEIGPLRINDDYSGSGLPSFVLNPYSWTKWLADHPEFNNNPFYLGGDSYCGIPIPIIAKEIADGISAQHKPLINLKGYLLGNPMTDVHFDDNSKIPFSHRMALITDELYELTKRTCKGEYVNVDPRNVECVKNLEVALELIERVKIGQILEPKCSTTEPNCISDPNNCTIESFGKKDTRRSKISWKETSSFAFPRV